jgi:glycosyltransferase involved in cell wall biosynthesis
MRCLLLHVEPATYIVHRLKEFQSTELDSYELKFLYRYATQPWDEAGNLAKAEVLFEGNWYSGLFRCLRLLWNILAGRYDVAHLAGWGQPILKLCIVCLALRGVPFSVESDMPLPADLHSLRQRLKKPFYRAMLKLPSAVIPGGRRQAEWFRYYGVPEARIHIAGMTVDTERIRSTVVRPRALFRKDNNINEDAVVFLFVGRLETMKGLDVLLEAFSRVERQDSSAMLVVVGNGQLLPLVTGRASLDPQMRYTGRESFSGVIQWMHASDVLVLPSTHEPWGLVVNEAMACGLPVIASDRVGCVDDLVCHGKNGFVVPAGDSSALADAMGRLLKEKSLRENMASQSATMILPWTVQREASIIKKVISGMAQ